MNHFMNLRKLAPLGREYDFPVKVGIASDHNFKAYIFLAR